MPSRATWALPASAQFGEHRLDLPASSEPSRPYSVRTKSCRHDAISMPSAEKVPGTFGMITLGMKISRAMATACSGPAPPNAIIAVSRGSTPLLTETARTASDIAASAICTMPSAASFTPSRVGPHELLLDGALGRFHDRASLRR